MRTVHLSTVHGVSVKWLGIGLIRLIDNANDNGVRSHYDLYELHLSDNALMFGGEVNEVHSSVVCKS